MTTQETLINARDAKKYLFKLTTDKKNEALKSIADSIESSVQEILAANAEDISAARDTMNSVMLDRLTLTPERIKGMADGIRDVILLADPVGRVLDRIERPNGLIIEKTTVPMGVVAIIYESRPNVTSDAAALSLKSGNVCILRGGREAYRSASAIVRAMRAGLKKVSLPETLINLIDDTSRESASQLMTAVGFVDLLIPRGGKGLIQSCVDNAKVPCIQTGTGICHVYVDGAADFTMALDIIENAKTSRPSVCNAEEVCLVDSSVAAEFLPLLKSRLTDERIKKSCVPVELRLSDRAGKYTEGTKAGADDFDTEFLNYILAVDVVDGVDKAVEHIEKHSTHHSDCIITENTEHANYFTGAVDSAAVYVNASTRYTDGGEFGLCCEIGISTQKLHARGPMGLCELTTYKYIVRGNGQIR